MVVPGEVALFLEFLVDGERGRVVVFEAEGGVFLRGILL